MANSDLSHYKEMFLEVALEYVTALRQDVQLLATNATDAAVIERLHRSAHSLKSQSNFMQYNDLAQYCKVLEFYFRDVKEGKVQVSSESLPLLSQSVEKLSQSLESIKNEDRELPLAHTIEQMAVTLGISM